MAEFSENRHISNLINMSCKVILDRARFTRFTRFTRFGLAGVEKSILDR